MIRSLFLKIFLWFWLTIGVLIAVSVLVISRVSGSYTEPLLCHYPVYNTTLCNIHINTPLLLYNKPHPFLPLPLDHPPPSVAITW